MSPGRGVRDAGGLPEAAEPPAPAPAETEPPPNSEAPVEIGGRGGLEPTRYGDWEKNGRCIDF